MGVLGAVEVPYRVVGPGGNYYLGRGARPTLFCLFLLRPIISLIALISLLPLTGRQVGVEWGGEERSEGICIHMCPLSLTPIQPNPKAYLLAYHKDAV